MKADALQNLRQVKSPGHYSQLPDPARSASGASFAFETTLSSGTLFRHLQRARTAGYKVLLFYIARVVRSTCAASRCKAREQWTTRHCGRGYRAALLSILGQSVAAVSRYRGIADAWFVNDSSSSSILELIALGFEDVETILAPDKWQRLKQLVDRQRLTLPGETEIRASMGNAICEVQRTAEAKSKTLAVTGKNSWSVPK